MAQLEFIESARHDAVGSRVALVHQQSTSYSDGDPLQELAELAKSAGGVIVAQLLTNRSKPDVATFIGKGNLQQLAAAIEPHHIDLVVFNHTISPIQERNTERLLKCRVIDRCGLILDIFAQRATSREGKLQVELAQLKYLSTRLVRGWSHLERQKGGIGLRGPGESQLEVDRRLIGQRIKTLSKRLNKVEAQRNLRRKARKRAPIATISLVGYTNAGKSSLFRAITGESVLVEDKLFATLDPLMRRIQLEGFGGVVLSDTVGFIRDLPHTLVVAFRSTLEEVCQADCLLLVMDVSDDENIDLKAHVEKVLVEIGATNSPIIYVYNKIDITQQAAKVVKTENQISIWLSAEKKVGVDLLLKEVSRLLAKDFETYRLRLQPNAGKLRSALFAKCDVLSEQTTEHGELDIQVKMDSAMLGWLQSQTQYRGLWQEVPF